MTYLSALDRSGNVVTVWADVSSDDLVVEVIPLICSMLKTFRVRPEGIQLCLSMLRDAVESAWEGLARVRSYE